MHIHIAGLCIQHAPFFRELVPQFCELRHGIHETSSGTELELWRGHAAKMFTLPVYSSVSFASYPKSFWESDLCKNGPLKAISAKRKKSQRTNNGTFDFSTFLFFSTDKILLNGHIFQNIFWQNSRQELNLKLTPQGFCITRHIDGVVAFGAISIWWFSGHLTQISTQDFVVLTGEIFFGRVLGHGRALVGQKWPVLGRYFQTKMESELYWRC